MAKAGKTTKFIAIKSMFESGNVKRMQDLEKITPTAIAKAMGLNHGNYIVKLIRPDMFKAKEILLFSRLIDVDSRKVWEVICTQKIPVSQPKKRLPRKSALKK